MLSVVVAFTAESGAPIITTSALPTNRSRRVTENDGMVSITTPELSAPLLPWKAMDVPVGSPQNANHPPDPGVTLTDGNARVMWPFANPITDHCATTCPVTGFPVCAFCRC